MSGWQSHVQQAVDAWKERLSCAAPECRGRRRLLRRFPDHAGSIHLQGQRYCFPVCFERELRRCFSELQLAPDSRPRPPHRVPLGLLMLSRGELTQEQLRHALPLNAKMAGALANASRNSDSQKNSKLRQRSVCSGHAQF